MRILIVDDVRLHREALADRLGQREFATVLALAGTRAEALALSRELSPDLVLLSASLPDAAGTLRELREAAPSARVIAFGVPESGEDVIRLAEAGVSGYLAKDVSLEEMQEAVQAAARGEVPCPPRFAAALTSRLEELAAAHRPPLLQALTRREAEVARLMAQGLSNKEIARRLSIQVRTVKNHVHNVLEKLNARRRTEVAARLWALPPEDGLPSPGRRLAP